MRLGSGIAAKEDKTLRWFCIRPGVGDPVSLAFGWHGVAEEKFGGEGESETRVERGLGSLNCPLEVNVYPQPGRSMRTGKRTYRTQ